MTNGLKNCLLALALLGPLAAQTRVAVLEFSDQGLTREQTSALADQFRDEILKLGNFTIPDREAMERSLRQGGFQDWDCMTATCALTAGMILDVDQVVTMQISKIGEVFIVSARLYDLARGRMINQTTYDYEYSYQGLLTPGMHNVARLLFTQLIPFITHARYSGAYYIQTIPEGATVLVGNNALPGLTPLAIDEDIAENFPVTLAKEDFQDHVLKPQDFSPKDRIISVELVPEVPQLGRLNLLRAVPENTFLVPLGEGKPQALNPEPQLVPDLPVGRYTLRSEGYVVVPRTVSIYHQKTTPFKPQFLPIKQLQQQLRSLRRKRNWWIGGGLVLGTAGFYLNYTADQQYAEYLTTTTRPDQLRSRVELEDQLTPGLIIGGGACFVLPVYYQYRILRLKALLGGQPPS